MSNATPKSAEHKAEVYAKQNGGTFWTSAQTKQIKKTQTRLGHTQQRSVHRETKRNARQRFREWMSGMR